MNEPVCYLALAAFPGLVIFVFDWWNAGWASKNHSFFLPPELKKKREQAGRPLALLRYGLLLLVLRGLAGSGLWYIVPFATNLRTFLFFMVWGVAGGLFLLACRHALSALSPSAASAENNEYLLRGPSILWLTIFLVGGIVEEFWQAVCIVCFTDNGYSRISALLLTAFAFSLAHSAGLPSRIAPGMVNLFAETLVGLMLGGLFVWSGNLITPCVASVVYFTSSFFHVRRRFGRVDASHQRKAPAP